MFLKTLKKYRLIFFLGIVALTLVGCRHLDELGTGKLQVNPQNFGTLENGFHYENWAIIDGQPIPAGKFNVSADGRLTTVDGSIIANNEFNVNGDLSRATAIIITIEPAGDTDTIPAATHYAAASLIDGSGTLTINASTALGTDFSSAAGKYILATPTNGPDTNENSGVWFLDPATGPGVGLTLPTLPAGWQYEGWAVINGVPVTSGRFTSVSDFDLFDDFSGPEPGPPFPGEDFLVNAPSGVIFPTDLSGTTIVISVEPQPDDSPAPFHLKPLMGNVPTPAQDHLVYPLDNNAVNLPTGQVSIR